MKTGHLFARGRGRIAICRGLPPHLEGRLPRYVPLVPPSWLLKVKDKPAFCRAYFGAVLRPLDPQTVWDELHALAGADEPILLCWERLTDPADWCHRRMVAAWLLKHLGQQVDELEAPPKAQLDFFDYWPKD